MSCNYCCGDDAIYYKDNENCAFIGKNGSMLVIAKDRSIRFNVSFCPMCGRSFIEENYLDLKKDDDIYYADIENVTIEHGTIHSVHVKDDKVDVFSVNFDCGDFDEFKGSALGRFYFINKQNAEAAIKKYM